MNARILSLALFSLISVACQPVMMPVDHDAIDDGTARVDEGTPEALGLLDFLNDPSTTYEMLDQDVGLDRRAAESIIGHRNGPDGELGWLSDDLFDSVAEVDDCYYVGNAALTRLNEWTLANGWVASGDDVLGTFDGVTFTVDEASAVVELVNTAGPAYLDDDLALNARTVDYIIDARPIATIEHLAAVKYVGPSTLSTLKEAAQGEPDCAVPGWDTEYIYNNDGAWRSQVPGPVVAIVDELVTHDDWCEPNEAAPQFVKVTVDRFNCEARGYIVELGQPMAGYAQVDWYIEFEIDAEYSWFHSTCEV